MSNDKFSVRDRRGGNRYFVDNAFLREGWGAKVGPYGIAVYNALALHADADNQSAWPSYQTLADLTGMSRRQVIRKVDQLVSLNIIAKNVNPQNGIHPSNEYILLAPSEWGDDWGLDRPHPLEPRSHQGSDSQSPGVVTHSHQGSDSQSPKQDPLEQAPNEQIKEDDEEERLNIKFSKISTLHQEVMPGSINHVINDWIKDIIRDNPLDWIQEAYKRAAMNNARSARYIDALLDKWRRVGGPDNDTKPTKQKGTHYAREDRNPDRRSANEKPPAWIERYRELQRETAAA